MADTLVETVSLVQIMQASIAPVTLISGVGLLILSMTNRYGRAIDRSRELLRILEKATGGPTSEFSKNHHLTRQIRMLYSRARLLRLAIASSIGCIFCTSLTIFLIFIHLSFGNNLSGAAQFSFILALVLLIVGMGLYLVDMRMSLGALQLETRAADEDLV